MRAYKHTLSIINVCACVCVYTLLAVGVCVCVYTPAAHPQGGILGLSSWLKDIHIEALPLASQLHPDHQ